MPVRRWDQSRRRPSRRPLPELILMRMLGNSFFDRFVSPFDTLASEAVTRGGVKQNDVASVIDAVEILLNTRSPFSLAVCEEFSKRTVIDYGLPDFLHLSPLSRVSTYHLARAVRDTIVAHEPRLSVATVDVQMPRPCRDVFRVMITGEVKTSTGKKEKVHFPVDVC